MCICIHVIDIYIYIYVYIYVYIYIHTYMVLPRKPRASDLQKWTFAASQIRSSQIRQMPDHTVCRISESPNLRFIEKNADLQIGRSDQRVSVICFDCEESQICRFVVGRSGRCHAEQNVYVFYLRICEITDWQTAVTFKIANLCEPVKHHDMQVSFFSNRKAQQSAHIGICSCQSRECVVTV